MLDSNCLGRLSADRARAAQDSIPFYVILFSIQSRFFVATVTAADGSPLIAPVQRKIPVLDANDNAPVFSDTSYAVQVPESAGEHFYVLLLLFLLFISYMYIFFLLIIILCFIYVIKQQLPRGRARVRRYQ